VAKSIRDEYPSVTERSVILALNAPANVDKFWTRKEVMKGLGIQSLYTFKGDTLPIFAHF
jgi:hypothetical protein